MSTERNIPTGYPNPYIYSHVTASNWDGTGYKKNAATVISWLRTPTGRLSKYFAHVTIEGNDDIEDVIEKANGKLSSYMLSTFKSELKKGYSIDKTFIYSTQIKG